MFLRETDACAVWLTVWEDRVVLEALESSPSYQRTTRELAHSGLLASGWSAEVLEVEGGEFRVEALVGALDRTWSSGS
jgi:hypothetical protein